MFKTETHCHTPESSVCGFTDTEQVIHLYKDIGFSTVIITDHIHINYIKKKGLENDWDKKVDYLMAGYKKAKAYGDKIGMTVLFATEIGLDDGNEYIVYGITEKFLRSRPNLHLKSVADFARVMHENGFLVSQAHPLRKGNTPVAHKHGFAAEVYNGQYLCDSRCCEVMTYAEAHNLLKISGSDTHKTYDIGRGGIVSDTPIKTMDDFIAAVKSESTKLIIRGQVIIS